MGVIQVPGQASGKNYSVKISGDTPSPTEQERIRQYVAQQEAQFTQQYSQAFGQAPVVDDGTALGRGYELGKAGAYSRLGTATEYLGSGLGLESLAQMGQGMRREGDYEAFLESMRQPAPTRREDVTGIGSGLTFLGEGIGQSIPEMLVPLAAGAAGTLAGGPALGLGAGAAAAFPSFFGGNIQRQEGEVAAGRREEVDTTAAITAAIGQSALNSVADKLLLGGFLKPGQKWLTRSAIGAGEGAVVEAPSEIAQQMLERKQAGLPLDSDDAISEYIDAGILGGIMGGGIRGTTAGLGIGAPRAEPEPAPEATPAPEQLLLPPPALITPPPGSPVTPGATEDVTPFTAPITDAEFRALPEADRLRYLDEVGLPPVPEAPAVETAAVEPTPTNYEAILDQLGVPRTAAVRKAVKSGAIKDEDAFRERLTKFASATTSERAAPVNEYLQRQAAPAAETAPATPGVQVSGIDEAVSGGVGQVQVTENGKPVPFKNFALSVDGNTAEVGMVERDQAARRGVGFDAYAALGKELASRGITLRSTETLLGDGRALWGRLEEQGLAKYNPQTKRFEFTTEIADAEVAPSGPVESDELRSGDGFERGSEQPSAQPVAGEPDATPAGTPDVGPVGGAVLGAREPSVAEGPRPDALTQRTPVDDAEYVQKVRDTRARGFTTPAETLVEQDEIAARRATLAEPTAPPMPAPQGPMTGQIPGAETGAAAQVIPDAVPEAPRFTPEGVAVDPDISRAIAAQEAQDKVAAQDAITAWYETIASPQLKAAARTMDVGVSTSPLPAADMQKIVDLLRKAPKGRAKGKITPERAAFTYFSKSPDVDFAMRSIAYDHAQVMETDPDMREPDFRRATEFDNPAEAAFFEGTGVEPGTRAAQWVRENLSDQARKLLAQYTFNDYRPIDYAAESSRRDMRNARQKELQAELDKFIADMGPATAAPRASFSMAGNMEWTSRAHPRVEALIRAGDTRGAVQALVATAPNKTHRRVAQKLLARIGDVQSVVASKETMDTVWALSSTEPMPAGTKLLGSYLWPLPQGAIDALRREGRENAARAAELMSGKIFFNEDTTLSPELILHEATHAVADGILKNKSHPLTRQLEKLRVELLKFMPPTHYGLTNVHELLTEGLTNPLFRRDLSYANIEGKPHSAWQEFKHIMRNWLRGLIGMQPKKRDTAATAVDRALDAILAINPNEMQSGDIVGASFAKGGAHEVLRNATDRVRVPTKADLEQTRRVMQDASIPASWKDTFMRLFMPLDYVSEAAAKYLPSARGVHEAIMQHQAEIQRASSLVMETTEVIAKNLSKYRRDQDVIDNFNRVLFQGTLNEVDARKPRSAYEGYSFRYAVLDSDGNRIRTVESKRYPTETERNKALQAYNTSLPPKAPAAARARRSFDEDVEQLQAYDRLRARYNTLPAEVKDGVGRAFELPVALGKELTEAIRARLEALLPNQKALQDKVYGIVYEKILAGQLIDPYQPLRRQGEYWLAYEAIDPETGRTEVFKHAFDSEGQRAAAMRMLETAPADQQIRNVNPYQNVGSMKARARVPMEFVARVLDTIDGSDTMDASVKGQVIELMFDTLPETSFVNSFRRRANIRGFIADMTPITEGLTAGDTIKNLRESSMRIGRQTADLKYGAKFSGLRTQLEREYNEFQERRDPSLSRAESGRQAAEAAQYHDLLSDYTTVPFKQRAGWSRFLTGGTYMLTLGFNVSTALITMSQLPLFVAPFLSGRYGMRSTLGAIGEAQRVLAKTGRERTVERVGPDGQIETVRVPVRIWDYSVDNLDFTQPENAYLAPLHDTAKRNGVFNRSLLQDELLGEQPTPFQRIAAATGVMQHHAERYSRETALISAYHLDLQKQMGNTENIGEFIAKVKAGTVVPTPAQSQAAAQAAVDTSEKTNGPIYAAAGPMASQNDIGAILYLFKRHPLAMLNLVGQTALRANPFGGNAAEDRRVAQKQLGGMMGMMSLMAGAMGLPMMQQIGWLYDGLFADDDEPDFETVVRTTLGEAGAFGLVDFLTDTRISERIGLGGAIYRPGFAADQLPLPYQVLEGIGGPVIGMGLKYLDRVPTLLADGEYQRAMEAVLPSAFANVARAVRFEGEGIRTMRYDPIIDDIGPFSVAAQALGFMPAQYAQQLAINTLGTRINNAIDTERTKLLRQRYVAMRKGDTTRFQEINAEIQKFNQRHPGNAISAETLRTSLTSHQRTTDRTHHGVSYSPRNDAYIRSITEQFGPPSIFQ